MSELLRPETLIYFLFFVVPGFLTVRIYELLVPTGVRPFGESLVDLISYSLLIVLIWSVPYLGLVSNRQIFNPSWLYYIVLFVLILLVVVVSPMGVAYGYYKLRTSDLLLQKVRHPSPTAWDYFFEQDQPSYVRFHMQSGETFGAYFGVDSFATSFPNMQQIYVQELYELEEDGTISDDPVQGSKGAIINMEDCEFIEFLGLREDNEVSEEEVEEPEGQ